MKNSKTTIIILIALVLVAALLSWDRYLGHAGAQALTRFTGATSSQPLALSADDSLLLVANPDNNTVSLFDLKNGNARLAEIPVGKEPNGVALSPDGTRAYVANTVDGTVSVLNINRTASAAYTLVATIPVGTEPYGLALTPAGRKLYVTNARSNTVSVIDTAANYVLPNHLQRRARASRHRHHQQRDRATIRRRPSSSRSSSRCRSRARWMAPTMPRPDTSPRSPPPPTP